MGGSLFNTCCISRRSDEPSRSRVRQFLTSAFSSPSETCGSHFANDVTHSLNMKQYCDGLPSDEGVAVAEMLLLPFCQHNVYPTLSDVCLSKLLQLRRAWPHSGGSVSRGVSLDQHALLSMLHETCSIMELMQWTLEAIVSSRVRSAFNWVHPPAAHFLLVFNKPFGDDVRREGQLRNFLTCLFVVCTSSLSHGSAVSDTVAIAQKLLMRRSCDLISDVMPSLYPGKTIGSCNTIYSTSGAPTSSVYGPQLLDVMKNAFSTNGHSLGSALALMLSGTPMATIDDGNGGCNERLAQARVAFHAIRHYFHFVHSSIGTLENRVDVSDLLDKVVGRSSVIWSNPHMHMCGKFIASFGVAANERLRDTVEDLYARLVMFSFYCALAIVCSRYNNQCDTTCHDCGVLTTDSVTSDAWTLAEHATHVAFFVASMLPMSRRRSFYDVEVEKSCFDWAGGNHLPTSTSKWHLADLIEELAAVMRRRCFKCRRYSPLDVCVEPETRKIALMAKFKALSVTSNACHDWNNVVDRLAAVFRLTRDSGSDGLSSVVTADLSYQSRPHASMTRPFQKFDDIPQSDDKVKSKHYELRVNHGCQQSSVGMLQYRPDSTEDRRRGDRHHRPADLIRKATTHDGGIFVSINDLGYDSDGSLLATEKSSIDPDEELTATPHDHVTNTIAVESRLFRNDVLNNAVKDDMCEFIDNFNFGIRLPTRNGINFPHMFDSRPESLMKHVVAFLNEPSVQNDQPWLEQSKQRCGCVFIGVNRHGFVRGLPVGRADRDIIRQQMDLFISSRHVKPPIDSRLLRLRFELLQERCVQVDQSTGLQVENYLVIVEITPSATPDRIRFKWLNRDGKAVTYIRRNGRTVVLEDCEPL